MRKCNNCGDTFTLEEAVIEKKLESGGNVTNVAYCPKCKSSATKDSNYPLHLLGIEGSYGYILDENRYDYSIKLIISDEIYQWLVDHDIEYDSSKQQIFIYNNIRYVYLGLTFKDNE